MKKMVCWMIFILIVSVTGFAAEENVDQLIAKYLEARGGLAKLQAVQTMRVTGKMMAGPQEFPISIEFKRPNQIRIEINHPGTEYRPGLRRQAGMEHQSFRRLSGRQEGRPAHGCR